MRTKFMNENNLYEPTPENLRGPTRIQVLYSARAQLACSRIRKNSEVCRIHGRILTNPVTTKHLMHDRAEYELGCSKLTDLEKEPGTNSAEHRSGRLAIGS